MNHHRINEPDWLVAAEAHGWVAVVSTDGRRGRKFAAVPVIAWADNGMALVADKRKGRLEPVTDLNSFVRLERADKWRQDEAAEARLRQGVTSSPHLSAGLSGDQEGGEA